MAVASEDTTARQWQVKTRLAEVTAKVHSESTAKGKVTRLKHGDILRTIFLQCNGAREYSENIFTANFYTFTVHRNWNTHMASYYKPSFYTQIFFKHSHVVLHKNLFDAS